MSKFGITHLESSTPTTTTMTTRRTSPTLALNISYLLWSGGLGCPSSVCDYWLTRGGGYGCCWDIFYLISNTSFGWYVHKIITMTLEFYINKKLTNNIAYLSCGSKCMVGVTLASAPSCTDGVASLIIVTVIFDYHTKYSKRATCISNSWTRCNKPHLFHNCIYTSCCVSHDLCILLFHHRLCNISQYYWSSNNFVIGWQRSNW